MFRRKFIEKVTLVGASAVAASRVTEASETRTVHYKVKGFTCITCAVGLETMLGREKGITQAQASYPSGDVRIEFNPAVVTEKWLKAYIAEMGFHVEEEHGHQVL